MFINTHYNHFLSDMGEKIVDAVKYLYGCIAVETESNLLHIEAIEKLPCPELSTIAIALAEDNQKHIKMIKEVCRPLHEICFDPSEPVNDFRKIIKEVHKVKEEISYPEPLEKEKMGDFIKSLADLEDCLYNLYTNFIQSTLFGTIAKVLYESSSITENNLSFIFGIVKEDCLKHRNILVESLYHYHKATQKNIKPSIRYQNPDAWIRY